MNNTSERHIINSEFQNEAEYYIHLVHIATYEFALKYVKGKRVLDYGSGSGYGSKILSSMADHVIGVDISKEAVDYANNKHTSNNLIFKHVSEISNEKFDIITSFQVIEHVSNDFEYIKKLSSLLKTDGYILISTPDKKDRLFNYIQNPWNIYHLKEYSKISLNNLLIKYFNKVTIFKIGTNSDFAFAEISRTRKQRIITLFATLSIYPNILRLILLNFQVSLYTIIRGLRKTPKKNELSDSENIQTKHTIEEIEIKEELKFPTELLAICSSKK